MYAQDQPRIAEHAKTPEGFADVVTFAIATQNQHFSFVGTLLDRLWKEGLDACPALTGRQKRGIAFVHQHSAHILSELSETWTDVQALSVLVQLPSIGIVKAGFILQLVRGRVGCLDTHNLKTLGLARRAFSGTMPTSTEGLTSRLHLYVNTCKTLGTPRELYDGWCVLIALKYPTHFTTAQDASTKHVRWCRAVGDCTRERGLKP